MRGGIHIQHQGRGTVGTFVERIYFGWQAAPASIGDGQRGGLERGHVWVWVARLASLLRTPLT
jgi:hypothetical protein